MNLITFVHTYLYVYLIFLFCHVNLKLYSEEQDLFQLLFVQDICTVTIPPMCSDKQTVFCFFLLFLSHAWINSFMNKTVKSLVSVLFVS